MCYARLAAQIDTEGEPLNPKQIFPSPKTKFVCELEIG